MRASAYLLLRTAGAVEEVLARRPDGRVAFVPPTESDAKPVRYPSRSAAETAVLIYDPLARVQPLPEQ